MLVANDVDLGAYVLRDELIAGITSSDICADKRLSIKRSPLGGCGLFYNHTVDSPTPNEDFEVLRVPKASTCDYMTLLEAFEETKSRDADWLSSDPLVLESQVIRSVLVCAEPACETDVVVAYIVAFQMLRKMLAHDTEYYQGSALRRYDWYLDVLSSVRAMICPPPEEIDLNQPSSKFFIGLARDFEELESDHQIFVEKMTEELGSQAGDLNSTIPFQIWAQLHLAVRSRTLEVPHRIRRDAPEDPSDIGELGVHLESLAVDLQSDDFTTNITLVPVLDFANHKNPNNAYFDVDADLGDIILKIKSKEVVAGEFEIHISYSPVECILQFVQTHGFAPQFDNDNCQVFEFYIENLNNWLPGGEAIAKWLRILPRVQLINSNGEYRLNLGDSALPLLLCGQLTLDPQWPENYGDSAEMIEALKYQRDAPNYEFITGSDHIPVRFAGAPIDNIDSLEELAADDWEALRAQCRTKIIEQMKQDLIKLRMPTQTDPSAFNEMTRCYNSFLRKFIENALEDGSLVNAQGDSLQWLRYRPPPRCLDI